MGPEQWRTPKGIALSNTATAPEAHTALTHTLQHLRHALRCAGRAMADLDEQTLAALRCAELCADVTAAARSCANLLDHLDGYGAAHALNEAHCQGIGAAALPHPAGRAL